VRLATDVARALGAVHEAQIVHRDVKPENVLVVDAGTPAESAKLIDFGIAKVTSAEMGENSVAHTRIGSVLGSTAFASPEQLAGDPIDPRTDVFALAVSLYEALSGQLPFDGNTVKEQIQARKDGAVVPIAKHGISVPPSLEALFAACLARDRARRPRDGNAMAKALLAVSEDLSAAKRASTVPPPPPAPSNNRAAFALGLAIFAVCAVIAALINR
jgi:serine/threonine-protein kinase